MIVNQLLRLVSFQLGSASRWLTQYQSNILTILTLVQRIIELTFTTPYGGKILMLTCGQRITLIDTLGQL